MPSSSSTVAAGLTSFYSWRLVFMTFFGPAHWQAAHDGHARCAMRGGHAPRRSACGRGHDDHAHDAHGDHAHALDPHELPTVMMIPLYVLALGALMAGLVFERFFIGADADAFWKSSLFYGPAITFWRRWSTCRRLVTLFPTLMMFGGFLVALYVYVVTPGTARWADAMPRLYRFLLNKWYFDELYDRIFVRPAFWIGSLFWKGGDQSIIDRLGPGRRRGARRRRHPAAS